MNYYDILGVSKDASSTEIKKAYKKLVKKYHPDVFEGDKNTADKKIKELNEAYETLSNPELKKSYDEVLFSPTSSDIDFSSSYPPTRNSDHEPDEKYEDLYRYDYYKKYTTNYYGVSREDLKNNKAAFSNNNSNNEKVSSFSKLQLLIIFGFIAIILIVFLIYLLSYVKTVFKDPFSDIAYNDNNGQLPYITFGMSYDIVEKRVGVPDYTQYKSGNTYAYWGDSYIIFDKYNYVIGWHNYNDYFSTDTVTGEDFTNLQDFYNMLETELY